LQFLIVLSTTHGVACVPLFCLTKMSPSFVSIYLIKVKYDIFEPDSLSYVPIF
jgi:hypothetical protein